LKGAFEEVQQSEFGYIPFLVMLLLASGLLTLWVDTRLYRHAKQRREGKYAFVLGCVNVGLALLVWAGNWALVQLRS